MPKKNNPNQQQMVVEPRVEIPSGYYYQSQESILIKATGFPGVIKMASNGDVLNWWYDEEVIYNENDGSLSEKEYKIGSMYPMNNGDPIPEVDDLREYLKSGKTFKDLLPDPTKKINEFMFERIMNKVSDKKVQIMHLIEEVESLIFTSTNYR